MNTFKVAVALFGLIYAGIAGSGFAMAAGVVLVGVAGMWWAIKNPRLAVQRRM